MPMPIIYLVRHGITPANKENRFAGRTGETLTAEGIMQMHQVGERLRDKNIAAIYCSPARRTLESAEILGSLLKSPVSILAELNEINIPHWAGLTKDEIRQKYGEQYPTWISAPQSFKLPGCETLDQVQKRAVEAIKRVRKREQGQNLLLVSHLIVLRCLVLYFQGLETKNFRSIQIGNGSILQVTGEEKGKMSVSFL
jgi:broad specificity phosphatase PhoE